LIAHYVEQHYSPTFAVSHLVDGIYYPHKRSICHDDLLAKFKVAQLQLGRFALGA
jgi:hypothetical protein